MSLLSLADVLPREAFQAQRSRLEAEVIAAKRLRRVSLGEHLTFLFENRQTILWQIHEMCRVEHIERPESVLEELNTYAPMLPGSSCLSATVLVEYADDAERDRAVRQLLGIHEHLYVDFGVHGAAHFQLDDAQYNAERISSVQFGKAQLSPEQRRCLANLNEPVALCCSHPAYTARLALPASTRAALVDDLAAAKG